MRSVEARDPHDRLRSLSRSQIGTNQSEAKAELAAFRRECGAEFEAERKRAARAPTPSGSCTCRASATTVSSSTTRAA